MLNQTDDPVHSFRSIFLNDKEEKDADHHDKMIAENNTNSAVNDEDGFVMEDDKVSIIELASIHVLVPIISARTLRMICLLLCIENNLRNLNKRNLGSKTTRTCTRLVGRVLTRQREKESM
jgi:hypothetical protein